MRRAALALAILAVATLALAARVDAFVYWTSADGIGRANLDGTGVNQSFISTFSSPPGLAVDGAHIYWTDGIGTIARANLDGTGLEEPFLSVGFSGTQGVAVDGAHVYWANFRSGTIGRANLDGTDVNNTFILGAAAGAGGGGPTGVAVDGAHVYWTNFGASTIGRANLDGTGVNQRFITAAVNPRGVAVDGAHVYWTNSGTVNSIGRANLDGTGVDPLFITGALNPMGVAVDGAHVYWTNSGTVNSIGRANLDGTGINQSFIGGLSNPLGVAVGASVGAPPAPPPPTKCTAFAKLKPSNEVPPTASRTSGAALVRINGTRLRFAVAIANPERETFTAGHIHTGRRGVNGPIRVALFMGSSDRRLFTQFNSVQIDADDAAAICGDPGGFYVNYHTERFPGGALRGQLGRLF